MTDRKQASNGDGTAAYYAGETLVAVPPSYTERVPQGAQYAEYDFPTVSIRPQSNGSDRLAFHKTTMEVFGEFTGVRCFTKGNTVAFLPTDGDHPNSYKCYGGSNRRKRIAGSWLKHELEMGEQPDYGLYRLERDGDLWVVDFDKDPVEAMDD